MNIGDDSSLGFHLVWHGSDGPDASAAEASCGSLRVFVGSKPVWGVEGDGFSWTWVELLEHLTHHWTYLRWEEGDPLGLNVEPEALRERASQRWVDLDDDVRSGEEERLWAFLESHDLAAGLKGAFPPSLFVLRQGNEMRISCKSQVSLAGFEKTMSTLEQLGNEIARKLSFSSDGRSKDACSAWLARDVADDARVVGAATGLDEADLDELTTSLSLAGKDLAYLRTQPVLLAAARMTAGTLPPSTLGNIFDRLLSVDEAVWTGPLDKLSEGARAELERTKGVRPSEQGAAVARWFRRQLANTERRVEPEQILSSWKVRVETVSLEARALDAICTWTKDRAPVVLVNKQGLHGRGNGKRATLAHEIGHLLMDRTGGLPLAEVLGGRVPERTEQRARAFAAELLLPSAVAAHAIGSDEDIKGTTRSLSETFGASLEIVAWQMRNGARHQLSTRAMMYLRDLVQDPHRF